MDVRKQEEHWLLTAGLTYAIAAFGVLLFGGGALGPLSLSPLIIVVPGVAVVATVIGLKLDHAVNVRWTAVFMFIVLIGMVMYGQWLLYTAACASV